MTVLTILKYMERSSTLVPNEGKHAIQNIYGTDNPDLNAFKHSSSFAYFDYIQNQRFLETKQPPFSITKHNTFQCLDTNFSTWLVQIR